MTNHRRNTITDRFPLRPRSIRRKSEPLNAALPNTNCASARARCYAVTTPSTTVRGRMENAGADAATVRHAWPHEEAFYRPMSGPRGVLSSRCEDGAHTRSVGASDRREHIGARYRRVRERCRPGRESCRSSCYLKRSASVVSLATYAGQS
jgi:hypothetical protein